MLDGDKQLHLHIENIGRGPAKKVGFYLLCEGQYATGTVYPNGILRSGRASWMVTGIAAGNPDSAQLMTYCLDRDNRVHVWSREGRYHSYEGDPQKVKTSRDLFAHWYGPVDESQLQRCAWSAKGPPS